MGKVPTNKFEFKIFFWMFLSKNSTNGDNVKKQQGGIYFKDPSMKLYTFYNINKGQKFHWSQIYLIS